MYRKSAVYVLLVGVLSMTPAGANDQATGIEDANDQWLERDGKIVPARVAEALDRFDQGMTAAEVASWYGANGDDSTVHGDIWSLCLSENGGCSVVDVSGTFHEECSHYPVADKLWIYQTIPAILRVSASGDAEGTWEEFVSKNTGWFETGTLTGTSCVVFDDPDRTVVRTNGRAEYTF